MTENRDFSEAVNSLIGGLRAAAETEGLPRGTRLKIAAAVRAAIVPRLKPGIKDRRLDAAFRDYAAGMRGLDLYRRHIRGHDKMSRYRRLDAQRRLTKAMQKRAERQRKRGGNRADTSETATVTPTVAEND